MRFFSAIFIYLALAGLHQAMAKEEIIRLEHNLLLTPYNVQYSMALRRHLGLQDEVTDRWTKDPDGHFPTQLELKFDFTVPAQFISSAYFNEFQKIGMPALRAEVASGSSRFAMNTPVYELEHSHPGSARLRVLPFVHRKSTDREIKSSPIASVQGKIRSRIRVYAPLESQDQRHQSNVLYTAPSIALDDLIEYRDRPLGVVIEMITYVEFELYVTVDGKEYPLRLNTSFISRFKGIDEMVDASGLKRFQLSGFRYVEQSLEGTTLQRLISPKAQEQLSSPFFTQSCERIADAE